MKVLSLFDGMSCGQLALEKAGFEVDTYYASEVDKYAIQVTQANYPKTIQVGDVCKLKGENFKDVSLIIAGSPCQGFSFSGKQLAFDDPRSALFFEFVRLLKEIRPKYFLLENVKMKKEFLDVITEQVSACYPDHPGNDLFGGKIEPILINSAKLSAQNRQRYYWTNIPDVKQPEEQGIVLRDILEVEPDDKFKISDAKKNRVLNSKRGKGFFYNKDSKKIGTVIAGYYKEPTDGSYIEETTTQKKIRNNMKSLDEKSVPLLASCYKGIGNNGTTLVPVEIKTYETPKQVATAVDINGHDILKRVYSQNGKSPTLNTMGGGNREPKVICGRYVGRYKVDGVRQDHKGSIAGKSTQMLELRRDDKTNNISTVQKDNVLVRDDVYWRKLTPLECERLQTVPDNYTNHVSNSQRYKMLGNGFTVSVVAWILQNIKT